MQRWKTRPNHKPKKHHEERRTGVSFTPCNACTRHVIAKLHLDLTFKFQTQDTLNPALEPRGSLGLIPSLEAHSFPLSLQTTENYDCALLNKDPPCSIAVNLRRLQMICNHLFRLVSRCIVKAIKRIYQE